VRPFHLCFLVLQRISGAVAPCLARTPHRPDARLAPCQRVARSKRFDECMKPSLHNTSTPHSAQGQPATPTSRIFTPPRRCCRRLSYVRRGSARAQEAEVRERGGGGGEGFGSHHVAGGSRWSRRRMRRRAAPHHAGIGRRARVQHAGAVRPLGVACGLQVP